MNGIIHHIEINVSNLNRSQNFWEWFLFELGYKKFQAWDVGFSFKLKDTYLVFVQTEISYIKNKYHRKNTGLNHIAFHVKDKDFVNKLKEKLEKRGVKTLYNEIFPFAGGKNHYALFFEDPDRIKVEIVSNT